MSLAWSAAAELHHVDDILDDCRRQVEKRNAAEQAGQIIRKLPISFERLRLTSRRRVVVEPIGEIFAQGAGFQMRRPGLFTLVLILCANVRGTRSAESSTL